MFLAGAPGFGLREGLHFRAGGYFEEIGSEISPFLGAVGEMDPFSVVTKASLEDAFGIDPRCPYLHKPVTQRNDI